MVKILFLMINATPYQYINIKILSQLAIYFIKLRDIHVTFFAPINERSNFKWENRV